MFKNSIPEILAHSVVLERGNFVLPDIILSKDQNDFLLLHKDCPHRRYPLHNPGDHINEIHCKFHNFKWNKIGVPLNNEKKLVCGKCQTGKSNLLFKNFLEPDHKWIRDLAKETNLTYSGLSKFGESTGSWLWLMDAESDLLHIYNEGIHPFLSQQLDVKDIVLDQGDGWIYQEHPHGWWVYVYPFCFIEYGSEGKLAVNRVIPKNLSNEFGFTWMTQFYYDYDKCNASDRMIFETMEQVFTEDVRTVEKQKGPYFPLMNSDNLYESHSVHFGNWYRQNVNT